MRSGQENIFIITSTNMENNKPQRFCLKQNSLQAQWKILLTHNGHKR